MSLDGDAINASLETQEESVAFGGTPYAQYPTNTRFLRADYKYYKTLADSVEFTQRVQPSPPPPQPPPPHPSQTRRPATAHPAGSGVVHRRDHRQRQQTRVPASQWREPEPGWRPIFPEPDLSSTASRDAADAPHAAASVGSDSPAPQPASAPPVDEAAAAEPHQQRRRRPLTAPLPCTPRASLQHQQLHAVATPLMLVDFSENNEQPAVAQLKLPQPPQPQPPPPQQQQQLLSMAQPAGPAVSAAAARFFRPKTAPAKVAAAAAAAAAADNRGLLILGRSLRAQSAKPDRSAASAAGSIDGVNKLAEAYDRALAVHGWRMEVPGDPYGIKRQYIPERKPINVTVPEPTVKPLPPRMRRTNRFTFFHTTMPRVVMSFDIHPNFTSEQYSKAKAALVKQGKWDYRYRDFSFMY